MESAVVQTCREEHFLAQVTLSWLSVYQSFYHNLTRQILLFPFYREENTKKSSSGGREELRGNQIHADDRSEGVRKMKARGEGGEGIEKHCCSLSRSKRGGASDQMT